MRHKDKNTMRYLRAIVLLVIALTGIISTAQDNDLGWIIDLLPKGEEQAPVNKLLLASAVNLTTDTRLLSEDFETTDNGWEIFESSFGYIDVIAGNYELVNRREDTILWGTSPDTYGDVAVRVQTTLNTEDEDNGYGVVCRSGGSDDLNGYYFFISGEGYYTLFAIADDAFTPLVPWTFSDVIQQGLGAENTLLAVCHEQYLGFFVNDVLLTEDFDNAHTSGHVALAGIIYNDDSQIEVLFDNVDVWTLTTFASE